MGALVRLRQTCESVIVDVDIFDMARLLQTTVNSSDADKDVKHTGVKHLDGTVGSQWTHVI